MYERSYKDIFIHTALQAGVLQFGEFELSSERISPYFFNAGLLNTSVLLNAVGDAYASAILHKDIECDTVFGPAYKGIMLATATVMSLSTYPNMRISSNRKEAKTHGDAGIILGAKPGQQTLIVDDVITSGNSINTAIDIIKTAGGEICGILVLLDRQEKGKDNERSAVQEIEQTHGITVHSVLNMQDILAYARSKPALAEHVTKILDYRARYGIDQ